MRVWLFNGEGARFVSGVFSELAYAEEWIARHALSGIVTEYPVDEGVFDWATANGLYKPKPDKGIDSQFIGRFTSGAQQHFHYSNGRRVG